MNMSWQKITVLCLCILIGFFIRGCPDKGGAFNGKDGNQASRTTIIREELKMASVAGEIGVPAGVSAFGITVFAEGTSHAAYTDENGSFEISGLPVGEFHFRAMRPDLESMMVGDVMITAGDLNEKQPAHKLLRVLMDKSDRDSQGINSLGSLHGRVTTLVPGDEDGVVVSLEGTRYRTVTVSGGDYELLNVPAGSYTLSFSKVGYDLLRRPVNIIPGRETVFPMVELGLGSMIVEGSRTVYGTVTVLLADGGTFSDFSNVLVVLEGTSFQSSPDSRGRFEFQNVPAGSYSVSASAPGFLIEQSYNVNLANVPAVEVQLTLVEDTSAVVDQGALFGRVLLEDADPNANAGVAVSLAGTNLIAMTDRAGNFEIYNVSPGTYDLVAMFTGYETGYLNELEVAVGDPTEAEDLVLEATVERPVVVYTNPSDGDSDVTIESPTVVTIQFSQNMDIASVLEAVTISPEVSYTYVPDGSARGGQDTVSLELDALSEAGNYPVKYDKRYTVSLEATAANIQGVEMKDPYEFSFVTGEAKVIGTHPVDGAEDGPYFYSEPVIVYFNAPIDPETISRDDIRVRPSPPGNPGITVGRDPDTGWSKLIISLSLDRDEDYTISIGKGAKTVTGNRIKNLPYKFSFKTRGVVSMDDRFGIENPDSDSRAGERQRR